MQVPLTPPRSAHSLDTPVNLALPPRPPSNEQGIASTSLELLQSPIQGSFSSLSTTHQVVPTTVRKEVIKYNTSIKIACNMDADTQNEMQKAQQTLMTASIFNKVVLGIAGVLAIVAVGVAIAFCPPLGLALVFVGVTVIAISLGAFTIYNAGTKEAELEKLYLEPTPLTARMADLKRYGTLFEEFPNDGSLPKGASFAEFLDSHEPYSDKGYRFEDLGTYGEIFKKKTILRVTTEVEDLKKQIDEIEAQTFEQPMTPDEVADQKEVLDGLREKIKSAKHSLNKWGNYDQFSEHQRKACNLEIVQLEKRLKDTQEQAHNEALGRRNKNDSETIKTQTPPTPASAPPVPQDIKEWIDRPISTIEQTYEIDLASQNTICLFGKSAPKPTALDTEAQDLLETNGYSSDYAFLSNAYIVPNAFLTIEGKSYPSVIHYLLVKQALAVNRKTDINPILEAATIAEAQRIAKEAPYNIAALTGRDRDLKRALFDKFVSQEGTPTAMGALLMGTGTKKLIAGSELDQKNWGATFQQATNGIQMQGVNAMGTYLEFIRTWLLAQPSASET